MGTPSPTYDAGELRRRLRLSAGDFDRLVALGLPATDSGQYDPFAVRRWLLARGLAIEDSEAAGESANAESDYIARTKGEACALLGVSQRSLSNWLGEPGFPGRAGRPGRQEGFFPIQEIRDWRSARLGERQIGGGSSGDQATPRERVLLLRAEQMELDLARERGELADLAEVERLLRRIAAVACSHLEQLPDRMASLLVDPAISDATRASIRREAIGIIDACREAIAEGIEEQDVE